MRIPLTLAALTAAACLTAASAVAQPAACTGRNLVDELSRTDPSLAGEIRASAKTVANGHGVLWRIEAKNDDNRPPSYLFATLALTDQRILQLPAAARTVLAQARRIALTVEDGSAARLSEALVTLLEQSLLPAGESLDAMLPGANTGMIHRNLKRTGVAAETSMRIRPWVGQLMLATTDCEYQRGLAGKPTLDAEIARIGEDHGIGAVGLESTEQQLLSLAAVPDAAQLALLKAALAVKPEDLNETIVQLYLAHDIGAITPLRRALSRRGGASDANVDALVEANLLARSKRMRDRAVGHLRQGGVFMAVGAEHIPGDNGVVALLQQAGFKVTLVE